ncbi:hypothetical protein ADK59_05200 [Streptomyces sp. XY332]|nr:hypothetical protein ADK59_05200 [Streptomyces sp. XY332]
MSTVTAGPSRPSTYDTRPDATLDAPPVPAYPSSSGGMAPAPAPYPWVNTPENTPTSVPFRETGSMPARSSASHEVSSSTRCCGSITSASRGEIPKNPASKSPAP